MQSLCVRVCVCAYVCVCVCVCERERERKGAMCIICIHLGEEALVG